MRLGFFLGLADFLVGVGFFFGGEVGDDGVELAEEFRAGVFAEDFVEPARVGFLVFSGDDFDDVAAFEFGGEGDHFAVDDGAGAGGADFAM